MISQEWLVKTCPTVKGLFRGIGLEGFARDKINQMEGGEHEERALCNLLHGSGEYFSGSWDHGKT